MLCEQKLRYIFAGVGRSGWNGHSNYGNALQYVVCGTNFGLLDSTAVLWLVGLLVVLTAAAVTHWKFVISKSTMAAAAVSCVLRGQFLCSYF